MMAKALVFSEKVNSKITDFLHFPEKKAFLLACRIYFLKTGIFDYIIKLLHHVPFIFPWGKYKSINKY